MQYVKGGGKLIVCGAGNAELFSAETGIRPLGPPADTPAFVQGAVLGNVTGRWLDFDPGLAQVLARRFPDLDTTAAGTPAAVSLSLGKGTLVVCAGPVGTVYAATHAASVRTFARNLVAPSSSLSSR